MDSDIENTPQPSQTCEKIGEKVAGSDDGLTMHSKVSFNPDIEIASYDPSQPLAKP